MAASKPRLIFVGSPIYRLCPTTPTSCRVYVRFILLNGWQVTFFETCLKTSLLTTLTIVHPEEIRELAPHSEALGTPEARALHEYSIGKGGAGLCLS
jgi:hypothetical protein